MDKLEFYVKITVDRAGINPGLTDEQVMEDLRGDIAWYIREAAVEAMDDKLGIVRDLIKSGVLSGIDWAGQDWIEAVIPVAYSDVEDLRITKH